MATIDVLREDLERLLSTAETWSESLADQPDLALTDEHLGADVRTIRGLRERALSTLLNVGLLGRQSSGKSFLISGLQGGLEYLEVSDGEGGYADKYLGILPSSPTPTTACPSTVVPVAAGATEGAEGRGLLRVRFADSANEEWVEIGSDLPPSVIAAYGASDGDVTNRKREHINRRVAEIQLVISRTVLPVKFFDLPGAEAPDATHEAIMRRAWSQADCFLYVSQGTATLTTNELTLIKDLYNHHLQTGKRVLWVLTGIDRAHQLGNDNRPAWRATLETNNAYLRERFGSAPGVPDTFVGPGFVPVSPAWEARASFDEDEGNGNAAARNRDASRMAVLRELLTELIDSGAGHRHLAKIAEEARYLLRRRHRPIADLVATHQLSVNDLRTQQNDLRERLKRAAESATRIREQLGADLEREVRSASTPFRTLAKDLHEGLDTLIDSGGMDAEHRNRIDVQQLRLFTDWMTTAHGPATLWQQRLAELEDRARTSLRTELGAEGEGAQLVEPEALNLNEMLSSTSERQPHDVYGLVQAAAAAVGAAGPIVGGVAWVMTSLSLTTVALPVGIAVFGSAAAVAGAKALKGRRTIIERDRSERKEKIKQQAAAVEADFVTIARHQGRLLIDAVDAHIEQYSSRLQDALREVTRRVDSPDIVHSREVVERLDPVERSGSALINDLQDFEDRMRGTTHG
ncbi:dynamin family protein [Streptomyces sp. NRRL WC-3742]|uniref:dynamin family protein n=1 Tax=Streptomyces sp. NRRL WC-3742 TaxID=1463934 RepID=UPI00099B51BF|nr:dynamin family protein [Streptomyces sp. NRRL WC-3742]